MAKDRYHKPVREALESEGWTITHDPFRIKFGDKKIEIDLGAERLIAAERGTEKIAVEVKSFLSKSIMYELHEAVGQFVNYRILLGMKKEARDLFIALPEDIFDQFFGDEFGQTLLRELSMKLIVYKPDSKLIVKWIK